MVKIRRLGLKIFISTLISFVYSIIILIPFIWIIFNSFKYFKDIVAFNIIGGEWTLHNYNIILYSKDENVVPQLINSIILTVSTLGIVLPSSLISGYGLARSTFSKITKGILVGILLFVRLVPATAIALPYFMIFNLTGLYDTYYALIIVYVLKGLPLAVLMMITFIEDVPKEIEEAAMVDGSSFITMLSRIVFPLILPGIAATSVFTFIFAWNDFLFAAFLSSEHATNLQVRISQFNAEYFIRWGELSAAVTISSLIVIIFAMLTQKYLIRGLTLGAVKG